MIRTHEIPATQSREALDALNRESGRLYTLTMVTHWRIYRKKGIWLRPGGAQRLNDSLHGGTILHAHSCDAAQQGFYKACKTTRTNRKTDESTRFPHKRKWYRTTIWKKSGIRVDGNVVKLSRTRGLDPIEVIMPFDLIDEAEILEFRLVFNPKSTRYVWHVVIEDGKSMPEAPGDAIAGLDMGEIHPAVLSTEDEACVLTARELRAIIQYRNMKQADIKALQSQCVKKSRKWWRLQRRWKAIRRKCERKQRDILHKVSREVANWCLEQGVGVLAIGDVRSMADGKRLRRKSQQKVSQWPHGKLRDYITYKCEANGTVVALQSERYTSQTCPACGNRYKPAGRVYTCKACGFEGHRDVVGSANIRTAYLHGVPGGSVPVHVEFRRPYTVVKVSQGNLSSSAGHAASCWEQLDLFPEAAGF